MDIAIKYEKIDLGNDMFIFKPVSVIDGLYDEEANIFQTNYGELCEPIDGSSKFEESYFGNLISKEELLLEYDGLLYEEALEEYYCECSDRITIAYYDFVELKLKVLQIPFTNFQKFFTQNEQYFYLENEQTKLILGLDFVKKIRKVNNIDEIYSYLDVLIKDGETIGDELKKYNKTKLDSDNFETSINEDDDNDLSNDEEKDYVEVFMNSEEENNDKKITAENSLLLKKEESKLITLKELRKEVKDVIKGQDKAVDDVTRTILINETSKNPRHKSHMLIMGPSGTGKTEMINIISKRLGIPYFKADATAYTKEGYVGKSVYGMLTGLLAAADGDIEKAQKGILIVDEIDKKLTSEEDWVGGIEIFNSFLKIMDRDIVEIDIEGIVRKKILFDTSNLTIIFMGAFAKLYEAKLKKSDDKKTIGFASNTMVEQVKEKIALTNDDLINAGMPPEFLGRIPVITNTDELELEDLVEILYKSKGGAIEEEIEYCKDRGIELKFTNPYIREIAAKAKESKTGARNLRKLVRESLTCAYDDVLSEKKIKVLKLTKETAHDPKKYYIE